MDHAKKALEIFRDNVDTLGKSWSQTKQNEALLRAAEEIAREVVREMLGAKQEDKKRKPMVREWQGLVRMREDGHPVMNVYVAGDGSSWGVRVYNYDHDTTLYIRTGLKTQQEAKNVGDAWVLTNSNDVDWQLPPHWAPTIHCTAPDCPWPTSQLGHDTCGYKTPADTYRCPKCGVTVKPTEDVMRYPPTCVHGDEPILMERIPSTQSVAAEAPPYTDCNGRKCGSCSWCRGARPADKAEVMATVNQVVNALRAYSPRDAWTVPGTAVCRALGVLPPSMLNKMLEALKKETP